MLKNKFVLIVDKEDYASCGRNKSIATGILRLGRVEFHEELVNQKEKCIGGGEFSIDDENKKVKMWGRSCDFGRPNWNMVDTFTIYDDFEGYDFNYYWGDDEGINLTEKIKIDW